MFKDLINYLPAINKEGYVIIAIFVIVSMLLFLISNTLGWIATILTIWCLCFFRDPDRVTPPGEHLIVSPADGIVESITQVNPPVEFNLGDMSRTRVSIFLSVFDVHVNRIPITGKVKVLHYNPGKFLSATLDKSSELNERQSTLIETKEGIEVGMVQIAGMIARRIVCDLDEKQEVKSGDRFGIIRFGSRVDIYLPHGVEPQVYLGQHMVGGETIIGTLPIKFEKKSKKILKHEKL